MLTINNLQSKQEYPFEFYIPALDTSPQKWEENYGVKVEVSNLWKDKGYQNS
jgi:hypothetical protein